MIPPKTLLLVTLLVAAGLGCTSFSFPGREGQGKAPSSLKDPARMVKVPGGKFLMGWSQGEPDEFPVHEVELAAFSMDRTEVENAHYKSCVEAGACRPSEAMQDPELGRPSHPVVGITWHDASRFCSWVGKRLPTEAEWEYAARTPELHAFPWEGRFSPTLANARGEVDGYGATAPVGSFPDGASGLGLLDMAGNVSEWTADWYDSIYYQSSPARQPKGPSVSTGARSVRGGSWADSDYGLRATGRSSLDPNYGKNSVGFRCAASGGK